MGKMQDLQKRNEDLLDAMRAIGKVLTDVRLPVPRRIDQTVGILKMYEVAPDDPVPPA